MKNENKENSKIQNEEDERRKIQMEEMFKKKLEQNQFKVMTTFKKIENQYSDGIIPKIKHHKKTVTNSVKNLIGEETDTPGTLNPKNAKKLKNIQPSKSTNDILHLSPTIKTLSQQINFQINKVKKSQEDLAALNALYLDNDYFNKKNFIYRNNRYNNNSVKFNSNDNINNNSSNSLKKEENYQEAIRKKKLRNNFEFIANNYHRQLSRAFIKYDPVTYLNNVKMLIQVSPTLREDITKIKNDVDQDVKEITDNKKYTKKFKNFLEKSSRSKSTLKLEPNIYKNQNLLKNSATTKNEDEAHKKNELILPVLAQDKNTTNNRDYRIKVGLVRKLIKKDSKRYMDIRDNQFDDMNRLQNISKEIENYIQDGNIRKNIDNYVNDYKLNKNYNQFKFNDDENNKNIILKSKDYYFSQRKKINNLLGELYTKKLQAKVIEKERKLGDKLRMNKEDYFYEINENMEKSLNEFDNNIIINHISIKEKPQNNMKTK